MKNLNKISDNSLLELLYLMKRIEDNIKQDFCHVSDHLPDTFKKQVNDLLNEIDNEADRRDL